MGFARTFDTPNQKRQQPRSSWTWWNSWDISSRVPRCRFVFFALRPFATVELLLWNSVGALLFCFGGTNYDIKPLRNLEANCTLFSKVKKHTKGVSMMQKKKMSKEENRLLWWKHLGDLAGVEHDESGALAELWSRLGAKGWSKSKLFGLISSWGFKSMTYHLRIICMLFFWGPWGLWWKPSSQNQSTSLVNSHHVALVLQNLSFLISLCRFHAQKTEGFRLFPKSAGLKHFKHCFFRLLIETSRDFALRQVPKVRIGPNRWVGWGWMGTFFFFFFLFFKKGFLAFSIFLNVVFHFFSNFSKFWCFFLCNDSSVSGVKNKTEWHPQILASMKLQNTLGLAGSHQNSNNSLCNIDGPKKGTMMKINAN